jgi:hypothetical protein
MAVGEDGRGGGYVSYNYCEGVTAEVGKHNDV